MKVLLISGSRNPSGQTAMAGDAFLRGVAAAGGDVEQVFLPTLNMERCQQCQDNGWGTCISDGVCDIKDDFANVFDKIKAADAVVFSTPVYFSDFSESLRAFTDRLRRVCMHEDAKKAVEGKKVIAISVAGGGGGGAPFCCTSFERTLPICGFDLVDLIPVRRQNLDFKLSVLESTGKWFAGLVQEQNA
ncbi:MAG: flavodoxin family protein [Armatimonadota bacterium]|nr:flavodoxin family protein [bacterium]